MRVLVLGLFFLASGCASDGRLATEAYERGDYQAARQHLLDLAKQGDASAINNLGVLLADGKGGPVDRAGGIRLYTLAARMGNNSARLNLANMGEPVPAPDLVSQRDSSSDAALMMLGVQMMQQNAQPTNPPSPLIFCDTRSMGGGNSRTTCQ